MRPFDKVLEFSPSFTSKDFLTETSTSLGVIVGSSTFNRTFTPAVLSTVSLTAPAQSDAEFNMTVTLQVCGTYDNDVQSFPHPVKVLAVADAPQLIVEPSVSILIKLSSIFLTSLISFLPIGKNCKSQSVVNWLPEC